MRGGPCANGDGGGERVLVTAHGDVNEVSYYSHNLAALTGLRNAALVAELGAFRLNTPTKKRP